MTHPAFDGFVRDWNHQQGLNTPALHLRIARWLQKAWETGERQLLLMAFRSSGKSTLVGLFCAWRLVCNPSTRILVLAADHALARKMVRNVKRIIERHPQTTELLPPKRDQWAADQFTVKRDAEFRDPSMLAKGIGANLTGSRADMVICDDVEVPNTCDTPGKRADLRERLSEIDYVLVPGGLQLYVGTPHSYYTLYADRPRLETDEERPFLDGFTRLEIPILDQNNSSAWPERFPGNKIESLRRRSGPAKFNSQMMLIPTNIAEGRLDPDLLVPYGDELSFRQANGETLLEIGGRRMVSASCWWDPSYGAPQKGDGSVIAAIFTGEDGQSRVHRIAYLTHDPNKTEKEDEATQLCRKAAAFLQANHLPSVTVETNGLGKFLPGLLRRELNRSGYACAVVEKSNSMPKDRRILEAFDARLAAGAVLAHQSVMASPLVREMREWRPGGKSADDGLDAVAGALLAEPVRLSRITNDKAAPSLHRATWSRGSQSFTGDHEFLV